ncbi:hypothetical protein B0T16DRAFT_173853 [Cercophora newfieldiana]|uniref:Uncharacterized protein n=1 Tax=Cercophora newfieldiana TaxID=92897 RepID=A0AA39Y0H0_9PEZI|nr:hypothetical protein B0T16DRAFT_173853 [Cercophora newfieldiana]
MVATWIFPLAIVVSLPYESTHRNWVRETASVTLRWLGSPQRAITATLENFRQIIKAHTMTPVSAEGEYVSTWTPPCSRRPWSELKSCSPSSSPSTPPLSGSDASQGPVLDLISQFFNFLAFSWLIAFIVIVPTRAGVKSRRLCIRIMGVT